MENKVNIGELDTLVTVQECTITRGTQGQKVTTYTKVGDFFAKVDESIDEGVANDNLEQGQQIRLSLYKIAGLRTSWQVVVAGTTYEIVAVDPISRWSPLCVLTLRTIA